MVNSQQCKGGGNKIKPSAVARLKDDSGSPQNVRQGRLQKVRQGRNWSVSDTEDSLVSSFENIGLGLGK